jgi:hypothetical protein
MPEPIMLVDSLSYPSSTNVGREVIDDQVQRSAPRLAGAAEM